MKRWLGSKESEADKADRELLRALVIEMQRTLQHRGIRSALIGGTALRHLTWLRRPSLDLDFVVVAMGGMEQ